MKTLPKIGLTLLALLVLADLVFLNWSILQPQTAPEIKREIIQLGGETESSPPAGGLDCGEVCEELIGERVASAVAALPTGQTVVEKTTETIVEKQSVAVSSPQITYLPLGGGGSSTSTSWAEVAGSRFTFDLADYTQSPVLTFEVNLRALHSNSRCYARIWDVSNKRAVDYSEQTTDSTSAVNLISLPLSIWRGNNNYYLELKSLNGVECYLDSPRIKIVGS